MLIVITDGNSQSGTTLLRTAADKLKNAGVNVLAVGVGSGINHGELQTIASSSYGNVFSVQSANYLSSIVQRIKDVSCKGTHSSGYTTFTIYYSIFSSKQMQTHQWSKYSTNPTCSARVFSVRVLQIIEP